MAKKEYTFDDVKNLYRINQSRNASFLEYYKNYLMYVMDRQITLDVDEDKKWMANVKSPTTNFLTSTLHGMYLTSQVQFDLTKKFGENESEEIAQKLISLNQHYYDSDETSENMDRVALDALLLGTGFGQVCYTRISDEVVSFSKGGKQKKEKTYSIPSIEYINPMDIYIDAAAKNIYSSRFIIIRKIKSKNNINQYYKDYLGADTINIGELESGEILETKDWNMVVRYMMFNNMPGVNGAGMKTNTGSIINTEQHYDILTDNSFSFGEKQDGKYVGDLCEIYELHTDDSITLFINGKKYGAYEKKFPWRKKPFFSIRFKESLNTLYGLGSGYLAYNLQKMSDMFLNLRMDISRLEATAPIAVDAGDSFFNGKSAFRPYPGQIVKLTDPSKGWKKIEYGYNPNTAGNEVDQITKMIQDSFGLSGYSTGVQQKVERVARGVQELIDSVDRAFAGFIKSYSKAMSFIQKYWTIMTISTVNTEYLQRALGDDITMIKDIDVSDIVYEYNFGFNMNAMKKASDTAMVQQYIQFLQTQGQATRPDGTPLIDQEFVIDQIIEKMDLPEGTKLTKEEALEYMKDQISRNAELKKAEQEQIPQPQIEGQTQQGIVPEFNAQANKKVASKDLVSATAPGQEVNNPQGINQTDALDSMQ